MFSSSQTNFQVGQACHISFQGLCTFRNQFRDFPSVCTTIFKRIVGLCFYVKSLMLYINEFVSTSSTTKAFLQIWIHFWIHIWPKIKKFQKNSVVKLQCVKYQWIRLNELCKLRNVFFFKFRKSRFFQKNSDVWILIKLQCVICQWICLNELDKLSKSFFLISNYFLKFLPKTKKLFIPIEKREYWIKVKCIIYQWIWLDKLYKLLWSFSNFLNFFWISYNFLR